MSKISGFKEKDGDKDKSNKLMSFSIDDQTLIGKYKAAWTKTEDLKNIELNALPVYDIDKYINIKIRTYGDQVYTNFCGSELLEHDVECESFTVISIDSLLAYENKYSLQVYLDNCAYKVTNRQMILPNQNVMVFLTSNI